MSTPKYNPTPTQNTDWSHFCFKTLSRGFQKGATSCSLCVNFPPNYFFRLLTVQGTITLHQRPATTHLPGIIRQILDVITLPVTATGPTPAHTAPKDAKQKKNFKNTCPLPTWPTNVNTAVNSLFTKIHLSNTWREDAKLLKWVKDTIIWQEREENKNERKK